MSADRKPIQPSDIRKGDLIRSESPDERAWEYRADYDGGDGRAVTSLSMKHYLLDRPTPPVELPTTPTLGWMTYRDGARITDIGTWIKRGDGVFGDGGRVPVALVTAFIPATAVPTEALDDLRRRFEAVQKMAYPVDRRQYAEGAIRIFLAAVDEANGTAS